MQIKKILLAGTVACIAALIFAFDLQHYLTLEFLLASKSIFASYYSHNPILVLSAYFIIYVFSTALSIPGATVLTLAGGVLFGLFSGTLLVSFASTTGATLAMLIARFLLRDWVQNRFSAQLKTINSGIRNEGGYYLFSLRLMPVVPFFVINLGMGLTPIRTLTFFWVSQLGMLPGTLVYVNAGSELGKINSIDEIFSPTLIISFLLLGIFPLLIKKILTMIQTKREV